MRVRGRRGERLEAELVVEGLLAEGLIDHEAPGRERRGGLQRSLQGVLSPTLQGVLPRGEGSGGADGDAAGDQSGVNGYGVPVAGLMNASLGIVAGAVSRPSIVSTRPVRPS